MSGAARIILVGAGLFAEEISDVALPESRSRDEQSLH
jgi:hypothetical protein